MVNRDKYDAIMDEFLSRMDAAASTFESEMAEHRETLTALLEQHEKEQQREGLAGGREAANRASGWSEAGGSGVGRNLGSAGRSGEMGHGGGTGPGSGTGHSSGHPGQAGGRGGWGTPPNLFD